MQIFRVPTGFIIADPKRNLEFLVVGDYGKEANIKADFLGLTRDFKQLPQGKVQSFEKKMVVTISTQHGCSMLCRFCDAWKVGTKTYFPHAPGNGESVDLRGLLNQIAMGVVLTGVTQTKRLNVHFARIGEPTFNQNVITAAELLPRFIDKFIDAETVHPVLSTMMPKDNPDLENYLQHWCGVKNTYYEGEAGLQVSINSTNDAQRDHQFRGRSLALSEISQICARLPKPEGRKYTLNFALADNTELNADRLFSLFDPEDWIVKITPVHVTHEAEANGIKTKDNWDANPRYRSIEDQLKERGFDVIVFIPSEDEDKGRITCGNALLSGAVPETEYEVFSTE